MNKFSLDSSKTTILDVIGPSGAGKDSVLMPLYEDKTLVHVTTSTTRRRRYEFRSAIPKNQVEIMTKKLNSLKGYSYLKLLDTLDAKGFFSYVDDRSMHNWLRERLPSEKSIEEYQANLIKEYDLIESDIHHGNVYGLEKASLNRSAEKGSVIAIRNEPNGARTLKKSLSREYNFIILAILPDSFEDIKQRINARIERSGKSDENYEIRIKDSANWVAQFPELANLVLHNTKQTVKIEDAEIPGLTASINSLREFVSMLK